MEYGFDLYNLGRIFMTGEGTQKNRKYDLRREGMSYNDVGKLKRAKIELIAKKQFDAVYMLLSKKAMLNIQELFNPTGFSKNQWLKAETTNVKLGIIFNTEETNYQVYGTILHYLEL